ncbi:uncharacterized protein BCR38DRAFT_302729, partial [Pseudomassariella vexata]
SSCNSTTLNTTIGSWPVTSSDTIFSIALSANRGVCDIARANRMADAELLVAGAKLLIPAQVCDLDSSSCLIASQINYTATCVLGGPHTYDTFVNDTYQKIAAKFEMAVTALTNADRMPVDPSQTPAVGTTLKIPQCSPSQCVVQPYEFLYGTYVDVAKRFNTTVGQIMAFNPTFSYSNDANPDEGPVITMPMDCKALAGNVTVIS